MQIQIQIHIHNFSYTNTITTTKTNTITNTYIYIYKYRYMCTYIFHCAQKCMTGIRKYRRVNARHTGNAALQKMLSFVGAPPAPDKSIPPAEVRTYLGSSVDVSSVHSEGIVRFAPKLTSVKKVQIMFQSALDTQQLTPGIASKLRGSLEWATGHSFGKVARIGVRELKSRPIPMLCLEILSLLWKTSSRFCQFCIHVRWM